MRMNDKSFYRLVVLNGIFQVTQTKPKLAKRQMKHIFKHTFLGWFYLN